MSRDTLGGADGSGVVGVVGAVEVCKDGQEPGCVGIWHVGDDEGAAARLWW